MNMYRLNIVLLASSVLPFAACTESFDYDKVTDGESIDASFTFSTRTDCDFSLTAINELGEKASSVLFSVYATNPYVAVSDGSGDMSLKADLDPLYQGYTEADGLLKTTLALPVGTDSLYIIPCTSGFGGMQVVTPAAANGLVFQGRQLYAAAKKSQTRALTADDGARIITRQAVSVGVNYKFFHYFTNEEVNSSTGELSVADNGVVSFDPLTTEFKNMVNSYFPESNLYGKFKKNSDFIINDEEGAEAFATFIGDGGFTNNNRTTYNGLYYYTYTEKNLPSKTYYPNYIRSEEYKLTAIFPNVHPDYIAAGTRVQLLYWDAEQNEYTNIFPKGTHIGFVLNYKGFNKGSNLGFSLTASDANNPNPYCSTPAFNPDGYTHGVFLWSPSYNCYILGMERKGGDEGDNDFNDILAKIVFTPSSKQGQVEEIEVSDAMGSIGGVTSGGVVAPVAVPTNSGTLAFEDLWPEAGDYDFNDFVTRYRYQYVKNTSNKITNVRLRFIPQAIGATSTNGFAIQLPIAKTNIASIEGAELEENDDNLATIIAYNDVRSAFGGRGGFINTQQGSNPISADTLEISIQLVEPVSEREAPMASFNPFLFVGSRSHEIHLVDYTPTSLMDLSLLKSKDDKSNVATSLYYRMDNNFPWALDLSTESWRWPYESLEKGVTLAYPQFTSWYKSYKSGANISWLGEVDETYLW